MARRSNSLAICNGDAPRTNDSILSRIARDAQAEADPNHHLWRNGRLWWIAFTVHRGHLQERVRFSLGTADVEQARRRRDEVFASYEEAAKCRISIRLKRPGATVGGARRASRARRRHRRAGEVAR